MWLSAASVLGPGRRRRARRLRPVAVTLAGLAPLLIITGCDPLASHPADQVVTVAAVPGIDNANLYLAEHDGYFTKAGLDVKIQPYSSVANEITALDNGSVNIIAADYGDMFFTELNNPIYKLLADGYDAAPGVIEIVTMPGSKITSPDDLAGQNIPVPDTEQVNVPQGDPDTLALASTVSVLQSDGVNLAAVNWEPMSQTQELDELVSGQVPAILVTGLGVYLAEEKGAVELLDGCSGPTSDIPLDGFFANDAWLRDANHATAAKDFQQAIYNADASATMPGPIQAILPAYAGLSKPEADLIATGTYPLSTIVSSVQRTADLMSTEGMIKIQLNVSEMVGTEPTRRH
jgi:NitT/TauT family transport system substrate-binding protein